MSKFDMSKPEVVRFFIESYEKEEKLRIKWNNDHQPMIKQASTFKNAERGHTEDSIYKYICEEGMLTLTRDAISGARHRLTKPDNPPPRPLLADMRKDHSIPKIGLGSVEEDPRLDPPEGSTEPEPKMRPVPPEIRKTIYEGDELSPLGRKCYMKLRNRENPENKYYFPETTTWDYGWRLKDSFFGKQKPGHGKETSLTKGIYCRSGPMPDPPHYKNVMSGSKDLCVI